MLLNKIAASVVITSSLLMVGCSSSDDNNNIAVTEYDGNWITACIADGLGESFITMLAISGSAVTSTGLEYSDEDCTVPAIPAEVIIDITLVYPGTTTTTTLGEARHVDATGNSILFDGAAPPAAVIAEVENNTDFGLFLLADGKLYSGADSEDLDGSTAAKRPIALDTTEFFVRQ